MTLLSERLETVRRTLYKTTVLQNSYLQQKPNLNKKQIEFLYYVDKKEGFYGGAAGGGKSSALLMEALRFVHVSDYAALLLRRTYPELAKPEALMDRARDWLIGTDAHWDEKTKTWSFPSGATLSFGYLQYERDKYQYQGAAFQFIGFDELTEFTESQFRYLFSRLRRLESSNLPLRMRAASNPGNVGHEWVKQRFISPPQEELQIHSRFFIPALLEDNPYLDQLSYEANLRELDAVTYEQLRHGNWDIAIKGNLFDRIWFKVVEELPKGLLKVRYWDLAATDESEGTNPDWTVGALMVMLPKGVCITDIRRVRKNPGDVETLIKQTAQMDGKSTAIFIEQEPGSSGKNTTYYYASQALQGYSFQGIPSSGSKTERARPLSSAAYNGLVNVLNAPWLNDMFTELELFPTKGVHDDIVDALSGAFTQITRLREERSEVAAPSAKLPTIERSVRVTPVRRGSIGSISGGRMPIRRGHF